MCEEGNLISTSHRPPPLRPPTRYLITRYHARPLFAETVSDDDLQDVLVVIRTTSCSSLRGCSEAPAGAKAGTASERLRKAGLKKLGTPRTRVPYTSIDPPPASNRTREGLRPYQAKVTDSRLTTKSSLADANPVNLVTYGRFRYAVANIRKISRRSTQ